MTDRTFLGWPFFEDRHRELAAKLEAWAADEIVAMGPSHKSSASHKIAVGAAHGRDSVDSQCRELVEALGKGGWLKHAAAEDGKLDVRTLCLIRETLARHSGLADFAFAMQGLGSGPIALAGDASLKQKYLPGAASGDAIAAFALSEPDAGSDVQAMTTTARRNDGGWLINGKKTWISNGGIADFYVVFAKAEEGISAFVVDAKEVDASERIEIVAPHPMAVLKLKNSKAALLGEAGQGFKLAMRNLDIFRTTVAAAALGFSRRALDESLARARDRKMFGQALAEFQMTQAKLADMATQIEAGALLAYRAAWERDTQQKKITRQAAMAKMFATEAAQTVIDDAVQICGGLGVMRGHPVERLYREVRALRIYEGATEVQKLIISRDLLKG